MRYSIVLLLACLACAVVYPTIAAPLPELLEGKVLSVAESCASFVVLPEIGRLNLPTTITRIPDTVVWSREPVGCSFDALGGHQVFLKPGENVILSYVTRHGQFILLWIAFRPVKFLIFCTGQGGVEPGPETLYAPGCDGIPLPKCISCPLPAYDEHARRNGYQGTIVLEVVILPDGSTSEPRVVQQYDKGLEQSAVRAVRKWRYKPLIGPGGTPVRAGIFVEVDYSLISR